MNKTHFYPRWPLPPTWGMEASICPGSCFFFGAVMIKVDAFAWSYGRVIYWATWILMRTGTVQEGIREIRTCINLLFWPCSKIMEQSSPRDQTSDYGWQGSFGGAWFYVVAEHGDSHISRFRDAERFENFYVQCQGSEIHVSTCNTINLLTMYSYGNTHNDGMSCALLFVFDGPMRFKRKDSILLFFLV